MYCTKWCPDCRRARLWLNEKGMKYTEVDVMSTVGADDQIRLWTGGNLVTPTFDIDGQIVIDFDEDKLREVLKYNLFEKFDLKHPQIVIGGVSFNSISTKIASRCFSMVPERCSSQFEVF